jgi:exonuclease V gamma subunit
MPLLHYSNRLECLIVPLAQELEKRDPFDSAEIVVPNFSLEKWISLKLAQFQGIAANLRFITLEKAINEDFTPCLNRKPRSACCWKYYVIN